MNNTIYIVYAHVGSQHPVIGSRLSRGVDLTYSQRPAHYYSVNMRKKGMRKMRIAGLSLVDSPFG